MKSQQHYLTLTFLGTEGSDILSEITRACALSHCNLLNIKMNQFGNEIVGMALLAGNWGAIAKIETLLPQLEQRLQLKFLIKRTTDNPIIEKSMSYTIQVNGLDKTGILQGLTAFLNDHRIPIEDVSGHTYFTHTGTRLVSLTMKILVPSKTHLASLREQFMSYCDAQNLDAFLEPLRG